MAEERDGMHAVVGVYFDSLEELAVAEDDLRRRGADAAAEVLRDAREQAEAERDRRRVGLGLSPIVTALVDHGFLPPIRRADAVPTPMRDLAFPVDPDRAVR